MATKIRKLIAHEGGIESRVSGLGKFLLIVGILVGVAAFVFAGFATKESSDDGWAQKGFAALWIAISAVALAEGIAAFILCMGFAEVIRLLKKVAGIPYGGRISELNAIEDAVCSECQGNVSDYDVKCRKCGATFENESA